MLHTSSVTNTSHLLGQYYHIWYFAMWAESFPHLTSLSFHVHSDYNQMKEDCNLGIYFFAL